ncbi:MAG: amidohydrolase [Deltaproteobacteria bacterium]|nr:amidohydrolase [Deltaproteobacteria bacterium]
MIIVDVHSHCFPNNYLKELKKIHAGDPAADFSDIPEWGVTEKRVNRMDELGIKVQILGVSVPNVYHQDVEISKSLAQICNDEIAEICRIYPDRYLGLASIPIDDMSYAVDELDRAITKLGLDGVILGTNIAGTPLSDDRYVPFFEEMNRRNVPLVLHPMNAIGDERMPDDYRKFHLNVYVGRFFSTSRIIGHMVFRGVFERLSDLVLIIPHAGGAIPFLCPRWDMVYSHKIPKTHYDILPYPPSHYLKRHYFDTALSYQHTCLRGTLDLCGIDRLVFGVDTPFGEMLLPEEMESINTFGLSDEEREKLFYKNAMKIFPKLENINMK